MDRVMRGVADAVRVAAVVAAVVCAIIGQWDDVVRFVIVAAALLAPRLTHVRPLFDAAFGATLVLATVAMAADWYATIWWIDLLIHATTTGATAVVVVVLLRRPGLLALPADHGRRLRAGADVLHVVLVGFAVGVLWEVYEWLATHVLDIVMVVGYTDTVVDLVMDGLGSVVASAVLAWRDAGRQELSGRGGGPL